MVYFDTKERITRRSIAEWLFQIYKNQELLSDDADIILQIEISSKTCDTFDVEQDSEQEKEDIIEICNKMSNILNIEKDIERKRALS